MKKLIFLIALFFLFGFSHPYYVSICQIDHNPKTRSLEITVKIFTNDFENTLETHIHKKLFLGSKRESKDAGKIIFDYIKDNLVITTDAQKDSLNFVGYEVENDITYTYVEIPNIEKMKKITVKNSILLEMYDNQTNIVHVNYEKEQKSMLLGRRKMQDTIVF